MWWRQKSDSRLWCARASNNNIFINFNSACKHRSSWIAGTGVNRVKLLLQVFVGQWSRRDLGSKSMVKLNFSEVNTLTMVADRPLVSMFVTPPWGCCVITHIWVFVTSPHQFLVNTNQRPINNPQKLWISRTKMDVHQTLFLVPAVNYKYYSFTV